MVYLASNTNVSSEKKLKLKGKEYHFTGEQEMTKGSIIELSPIGEEWEPLHNSR